MFAERPGKNSAPPPSATGFQWWESTKSSKLARSHGDDSKPGLTDGSEQEKSPRMNNGGFSVMANQERFALLLAVCVMLEPGA